MDLFQIAPVSVPIEERIEVAVNAIFQLFMNGMACVVPLSGGKDSHFPVSIHRFFRIFLLAPAKFITKHPAHLSS